MSGYHVVPDWHINIQIACSCVLVLLLAWQNWCRPRAPKHIHIWRVLSRTYAGPTTRGFEVSGWRAAERGAALLSGQTVTLVCCDGCGAKHEHVQLGSPERS